MNPLCPTKSEARHTGYAYDTLGRTTTVPASDAQGIAGNAGYTGNLTVAYYSNDMVASQSQGSGSTSFTLDPALNRINTETPGSTTSTNHYSDTTDSPTWMSTSSTVWVRNLTSPGGLIGTQDQTGAITLDLTNPHGDIIATAPDTTTAAGIANYAESTEYGAPRAASAAYGTYGYLGTPQRSSSALGGALLMGVRLYNPTSGRFLSVDPLPGGNANPYDYADQDPINNSDTSGRSLHCTWSGSIA